MPRQVPTYIKITLIAYLYLNQMIVITYLPISISKWLIAYVYLCQNDFDYIPNVPTQRYSTLNQEKYAKVGTSTTAQVKANFECKDYIRKERKKRSCGQRDMPWA